MVNGNLTNWFNYPENVTGVGSFFQHISTITNDWLAIGFLLIIWIFTFGASMMSGSRKALLTSSFITLIFSIYFIRLDMINPVIVFSLLVLTIIGAIASYNEPSL
jgi:uncharacterized membrane protein YGL010W